MSATIVYRRAEPADLEFVVSSWVSSFRPAHAAGILSNAPLLVPCPHCCCPVPYDYMAVMPPTVRAILQRPGVAVWVASNPRAAPPNDLHGYLVIETGANLPSYRPPTYELTVTTARDPMVHFAFVKRAYRGFGIARALFAAAGVEPHARLLYSCKTADVPQLEKKLIREQKLRAGDWQWCPLSVRFTKQGKSS